MKCIITIAALSHFFKRHTATIGADGSVMVVAALYSFGTIIVKVSKIRKVVAGLTTPFTFNVLTVTELFDGEMVV
ncbi:MAG: hypothetical protein QME58_13660 [Bacteroidota bacterium]|nr:hypothetical protein [Bacteroidota bacterium]